MNTLTIGFFLMALTSPLADRLEFIKVADGGRGFVLADGGRPFIAWGHNYGNGGRLIEDYWETDWQTVVDDFGKMKAMGTNVARVHLQFGKFMMAADRPDPKALDRLGKLLALAESTGVYLDLTGLACYRKADVPPWYDLLDEAGRWKAQARFWSAIAGRCASSPAVFCYDLMNEPIAPGQARKPGDWYSGNLFGGLDFLQLITLDPAGRAREDIPPIWIAAMTKAIRKEDKRHLITVGVLPWVKGWGFLSGFIPEKIAPVVDFVSVHIYPDNGKPTEAIENLRRFAVGKPVVIEETFPLSCTAADLEVFLRDSRGIASGWIGHYDGKSIAELDALERAKTITLAQAIYKSWLEMSVKMRSEMTAPVAPKDAARP